MQNLKNIFLENADIFTLKCNLKKKMNHFGYLKTIFYDVWRSIPPSHVLMIHFHLFTTNFKAILPNARP